jgi:hypothetical protein
VDAQLTGSFVVAVAALPYVVEILMQVPLLTRVMSALPSEVRADGQEEQGAPHEDAELTSRSSGDPFRPLREPPIPLPMKCVVLRAAGAGNKLEA